MAHTPRLLLKAVHCVIDTDEDGGESPYFLITVGKRGAAPKLFHTLVRLPEWDNQFNKGTRKTTQQLVASSEISGCPALDANTLVLVSLIEEDVNCDLSPGTVNFINSVMMVHWLRYGGNEFANLTTAQVAELMILRLRPFLEGCIDNDDLMGVKHLPLTTLNGDLDLLTYVGDDGKYRVRFATDIPGA